MPVMDSCLVSHKDDVCRLLKTLQTATRVMQIVCTESKVSFGIEVTEAELSWGDTGDTAIFFLSDEMIKLIRINITPHLEAADLF